MDYLLRYAGVPFVSDRGRVFRMSLDTSEAEKKEHCEGIDKQQPESSLLDEIDRLFPFDYLRDFYFPSPYPGRNLGAIAYRSDNQNNLHVKIGQWYYPNTACRWSVFRGLATSAMVKQMLSATQGTGSATFTMMSSVKGAGNPSGTTDNYTLETRMYMLPARPLAEHGGNRFAGLYLITLVDERFYFQNTPVSLHVNYKSTWQDLIYQVSLALNITINTYTYPTVYGKPELDSQLWTNWESAPVLLDALAANIGKTVVRKLDGTYSLLSPTESSVVVNTNRTTTNYVRMMGGDIFNSDTRYPVGDLRAAMNAAVPRNIHVTFPLYVIGDDPVPHFVNSRSQNQRRSTWYEESYGDVYTVSVPIQSGGSFVSGLTGVSERTVRETAKALISGEIQVSGIPLNVSGVFALARQVAEDQYGLALAGTLDEAYPGTFKWNPDGVHDILWTYSEHFRHASCRVMRSSWTLEIDNFQHSTPAMSGSQINPRGVGGQSVAQTIRDSQQFSGTVTGAYITAVLFSGQMVAAFDRIDNLPTDNRWRGQIENEVILFEGTSGGFLLAPTDYSLQTSGGIPSSPYSLQTSGSSAGYFLQGNNPAASQSGGISWAVGIVYRGIDGTIETNHLDGFAVTRIDPDVAYGVNLTTYGRNQFIFPSEWTSGGINGAKIVPQTQFVQALSASGAIISGTPHYSGRIQLYNPAVVNTWTNGDNVWIVGTNSGTVIQSGVRYGATFEGYSVYSIGLSGIAHPAPVYVPVGGVGGAASVLSVRDQYGASGSWQFSGQYQHSGYVTANLYADLVSGSKFAVFDSVDYLPTQNRWRGFIGNSGVVTLSGELMLFDGTSGGLKQISGQTNITSGYYVTIAQRGTQPASGLYWLNGTLITEVQPHSVSGINLITHEKMAFVYPAQIESGTTEVKIVPQTQSVMVLDSSGRLINNILHYSGVVLTYDPSVGSGKNWVTQENVWIRERNAGAIFGSGLLLSGLLSGGFLSGSTYSGTVYSGQTFSGQYFSGGLMSGTFYHSVVSGRIYDGQILTHSKRESGSVAAPVYGVTNSDESFQVLLTDKKYNSNNVPVYSWVRDDGLPLGSGGPDANPLYHEDDYDIAVPARTRVWRNAYGDLEMADDPRWELVRKTDTTTIFVPISSGAFYITSGSYTSGQIISGSIVLSGDVSSGQPVGQGGWYYRGVLLRYDQQARQVVVQENIYILDVNS